MGGEGQSTLDDARLPELIRDEIKDRTFFVLCNARASRRSKWVEQKIELVKQVTKRRRQTVVVMNLETDLQTERHKLDRLKQLELEFFDVDPWPRRKKDEW